MDSFIMASHPASLSRGFCACNTVYSVVRIGEVVPYLADIVARFRLHDMTQYANILQKTARSTSCLRFVDGKFTFCL